MMRNQVSRMRTLGARFYGCVMLAALAACTSESVMDVRPDIDVGTRTAALPRPGGMQALVPDDPYLTKNDPYYSQAAYPRPDDPSLAPPPMSEPEMSEPDLSPAPTPAVMPGDEIACRRDLKRMGVVYRDLPAIHGGGTCGIDWPVQVTAIGSVKMQPAATLTCDMAATFSKWTEKELVPTARWKYWSGVKTIRQGSSYSCRNIRGTSTPSQHGQGNALDVMAIELNNGKDIDVRKPGWFAFRQRGFLNSVRADGCQYFTTVLGPGYNADHANHFHFDIMKRKNGYTACR